MIYIVTPVFNRKAYTRDYLIALSRQTVKDFKVVIVDDGSTDGTSKMIEKQFPNVILLKEQGDLWWSEATNIGVRYAINQGAVYVMTLNDDTLPATNFVEKMITWSRLKPCALLGALAINEKNNEIIYGGEILNWKTGRFENILDKLTLIKRNGLHRVNIFPGRGLLIPVQTFTKLGLYDSKNFPQIFADIDFTARADKAGFEIFCNYDAKIKIYPEESGGMSLRKNKSWKNYYQHLFGMKGGGNLIWFTIFAFKNAPKQYRVQFWLKGSIFRMGGYLLEWCKEAICGRQ
ncbi:MAG: family 2 glycosyl transferase [Flavobacteriaceae bacterium]|nr:family 2 glycosyl transferase [Flavobacteriaceae bacterium]|tara:strand:- start:1362 stop:2231 length:870 start_codon:yes stop_codon:yes gene_type:complete